jgi:hypothetical protein
MEKSPETSSDSSAPISLATCSNVFVVGVPSYTLRSEDKMIYIVNFFHGDICVGWEPLLLKLCIHNNQHL